MDIDMSVEDCTNELLVLQMELWPSCQVLPGAEVRTAFYGDIKSDSTPSQLTVGSICRYLRRDSFGT